MDKPKFRGPPYKGEINPKTGRPFASNPRAHGARVRAWNRKPAGEGYGTKTQGQVWKEWQNDPEYKKSKEYIEEKKEAEGRESQTPYDKGAAVERAKEQLKIPTLAEQQAAKKAKKEKQEREGDWQTNPDFDREEGGWKPEDVASSFRNALTISNAIKKGKQALSIGVKTIGATATALKALTIGEF